MFKGTFGVSLDFITNNLILLELNKKLKILPY